MGWLVDHELEVVVEIVSKILDFNDLLGSDNGLNYTLRVDDPGSKIHNLQSMIFSIAECIIAVIELTTHVSFVIVGKRVSYPIVILQDSFPMNPHLGIG